VVELWFGMRPLRLLAPCDPENGFPVLYHITSRVVEKQFIFNEVERAKFLKLAKDFAFFSGFELVSWCLMSNHFHLLVRVPVQDVEAISDAEMVDRLARILSPKRLNKIVGRLNATSAADMRRDVLDSFRKRVGHLPSYVKAVKQEFTQWFNHVKQREGTLWEGRYHSTLIEDTGGECPEREGNGAGQVARIVASYIDMNPVRANVEEDPKDSTWSSYGMALRGDGTALRGLRVLWGAPDPVESPMQTAENTFNPRPTRSEIDKQYLAIHRSWILRREDPKESVEEDSAGDPELQSGQAPLRPRGRPPRLTGLRRIRLLGSRRFCERFGLEGGRTTG